MIFFILTASWTGLGIIPGISPLIRPPSWIEDLPVASPSLPFPSLLSPPLSLYPQNNRSRATGDEAVYLVNKPLQAAGMSADNVRNK